MQGQPDRWQIRRAQPTDADAMGELVRAAVVRFNLADCTDGGRASLLASLAPSAFLERMAGPYQYLVAELHDGLAGVAGVRDRTHLYHLFVAEPYVRRGLGTALWEAARAASGADVMTVNASLFAQDFYRGLGFVPLAGERTHAGITSIPMVWPVSAAECDPAGPGGRGERPARLDLPFGSDAELEDLVARFEACRWPYVRWTHRAHLAVALVYLRDRGGPAALERLRRHIPLYNRACGDPDGYHETLTALFVRRLASHLERAAPARALAGMVEECAQRYSMRWPLDYYSPGRLWSDAARRGWVEPDLRELDF